MWLNEGILACAQAVRIDDLLDDRSVANDLKLVRNATNPRHKCFLKSARHRPRRDFVAVFQLSQSAIRCQWRFASNTKCRVATTYQ